MGVILWATCVIIGCMGGYQVCKKIDGKGK